MFFEKSERYVYIVFEAYLSNCHLYFLVLTTLNNNTKNEGKDESKLSKLISSQQGDSKQGDENGMYSKYTGKIKDYISFHYKYM